MPKPKSQRFTIKVEHEKELGCAFVMGDVSIPHPLKSVTRARALRRAIDEALNHPAEIEWREERAKAAEERRERENRERQEQAERKERKKLRNLATSAKNHMAHNGIEMQDFDVILFPHDTGSWGRNKYQFYTVVHVDGQFETETYPDHSKGAAVQAATEEHEGRIIFVKPSTHEVQWIRKGQKSSRQYESKWRIYKAKPQRGYGMSKGDVVWVYDEPGEERHGKVTWHTTRHSVRKLDFDSYDEAQAWIKEQQGSDYRPQFMAEMVKVPVPKS